MAFPGSDGQATSSGDRAAGPVEGLAVPATPTASRLVFEERKGRFARRPDMLAIEEPLELRLAGPPGERPRVLTVTMRTPGHDFELVAGWLLAEGIVARPGEIRAVRYCQDPVLDIEQRYNVVTVELSPAAVARHADRGGLEPRLTATSSSCGVCGSSSIASLVERSRASRGAGRAQALPGGARSTRFAYRAVLAWPERLRDAQAGFSATGGLHAAGLVSPSGRLLVVREDVGRHNAVDKVVGWVLQEAGGRRRPAFPLSGCGLVVSGRTSFEIVQKAIAAGIDVVASVSAASSLAARLADEAGITLVGFLRAGGAVVYAHPERLALE
jgi:FdhD protein